jgi:fatty acid-binding protein DegV
MEAALDRLVSAWHRDRIEGTRTHIVALHADAPEQAQSLIKRVQERATGEIASAFVGSFGTVMTAHTGPGLVGLAWRWARVTS